MIPALTVCSESGGVTTTEPEIMSSAEFASTVRSLKVEMGPAGEHVRVTAELLPSSVLLTLKNPVISLVMDGQPVAAIILADGTEIRFG